MIKFLPVFIMPRPLDGSVCPVCLRSLGTTASGLLRVPGLLSARCTGSGKHPRLPTEVCMLSRPCVPSSLAPSSPPLLSIPSLAIIPKSRVLRHIPKSATQQCRSKLTSTLEKLVRNNTVESWNRLFLFAPVCLRQPRRSKHAVSLSSQVKQQLQVDLANTTAIAPAARCRRQARRSPNPEPVLARRVAAKIEDGDFRGAVRLATSDNTLADFSDDTYTALCAKHPSTHPDSQIPPSPIGGESVECEVSRMDVIRAIRSFPCGSAGCPDKLHPQHLKDLLQHVQQFLYAVDEDLESPLFSA